MDFIEGIGKHIIAVFFSVIVMFLSVKYAKQFMGEALGKFFVFIFAGIVFLAGMHLIDLLGPEGFNVYLIDEKSAGLLEHTFFVIGMTLFAVGLVRISKALR